MKTTLRGAGALGFLDVGALLSNGTCVEAIAGIDVVR